MAATFQPGADFVARLGLLAAFLLVAGGIAWWWGWPRTYYRRNENGLLIRSYRSVTNITLPTWASIVDLPCRLSLHIPVRHICFTPV